MGKPVLFVSFSGGRTSGYMCWWLKKYASKFFKLIFVFANTGLEHEETLIFVDKCDKDFDLKLVWVEAVVNDGRVGSTHRVVNFESASREGEPFEAVIEKYGIPNPDYPHCNRELKLAPIKSYKKSIGYRRDHLTAIGIRSDEMDRISIDADKDGLIYPLICWQPTTKEEIRHWWKGQGFDLDLSEHLGNCKTCWKKSFRKLMTTAKHTPEEFEFFYRMEEMHGNTGAGDQKRVFFRDYKTAKDIIAMSKQPFIEFVDYMPELQLRLIEDIDELDKESDCGASCEAG